MPDKELEQFLSLLDETTMTQKDFEAAFKAILSFIVKIEKNLINRIDKSINESTTNYKAFKTNSDKIYQDAKKEQSDGLKFIKGKFDTMAKGKDGKEGYTPQKNLDYFDGQPGKDADEEKIIMSVLDKIEVPEIDKGIMNTLEEELAYLKSRPLGGGGFSKLAMDGHIVDLYTPSGTINGTNKAFTLSSVPNPTNSLEVYVNGQLFTLTEDYTISGLTLTLNTAPPTTSLVRVKHRK